MSACSALIALACVARLTSGQGDTPGFQFLGFGYDVLLGNPLATDGRGDLGFRTNIFDFTHDSHLTTSDLKWKVPDKTTSQDLSSCSESQEQKIINSAYEYDKTISNRVKLDAGYLGVTFNFGSDYKNVVQNTKKETSIFAMVQAVCAAYELTMHLYDSPDVSPNFAAGVRSLPKNYDEAAYMTFIQRFGTHAVTQLHVGGRWGWLMEFHTSDYKNLLDNDVSITAGIHYAGQATAGIDFTHSTNISTMREVTSAISANYTFNSGGTFNPNAEVWMTSVKAKPMPLVMQLTMLDKLFADTYLPGQEDLEAKKAAMGTAVAGYCDWRRRTLDSSVSCDPPEPKPMPKPDPVDPDAVRRVCVQDSAAFNMHWDLIDVDGDAQLVASTSTYSAGHAQCLEGDSVRAARNHGLQCRVHAVAGRTKDCTGGPSKYDARSTLQANYVCTGSTLIFDCKFKDLTKMDEAQEEGAVVV